MARSIAPPEPPEPVKSDVQARPVSSPARPLGAPIRARPGFRDLLLMTGIAVAAALLVEAPTLIRVPFGVLAVILVPGYALAAALFPTDEQIDRLERVGLGLGLSLAMIAVEVLVLDRVLGGITPEAIRTLVTTLALALLGVAFVRRLRAGGDPSAAVAEPPAVRRPTSQVVRFTQAIVVASVAVAALAYGLTIGDQPTTPTEFYVLGREGQLAGYPRQVLVGEPVAVRLGVRQSSGESGRYRLVAQQEDEVLTEIGPIVLGPGAEWQEEVAVRPVRAGADQALLFLLFAEGETTPRRTLRLWVDVRDRGAR